MAARAALPVLVVVAAACAMALHRSGHTQGDDFALYLRQARSLFDGDVGDVVADNRFSVLWSDGPFSPIAYPWGWPIILSPFVHQWGFDYDRLKLVEVALLCVWLVLLHGIVRRRIGRLAALAVTAVFATAPIYLVHTDQLLTEIPQLAAVAVFIWWYDRIRRTSTLLDAPLSQLVVLGCLVTVAFNMRRESIALVGVIVVMQLYDLARQRRLQPPASAGSATTAPPRPGPWDEVTTIWRRDGRAIVTPYLAFAVSVAVFQFLLPTALLPDNDNELSYLDDRFKEYPAILADQVGLGDQTWVGVVILLVALVGAVIGVRRRPTLDGPLLALGLISALAIGTHLREVTRYWMQVTPWVVYFVVVALVAAGQLLSRHLGGPPVRSDVVRVVMLAPLLVLVIAHAVVLRGDIDDTRRYHDAGRVLSGPTNPAVAPIYTAVNELTPPDAIVAYFRARTMTLLTDRLSFQTKNLDRIAENADYFAQRRNSTYWQPTLSVSQARMRGWEEVWSDQYWILWRIPETAPE